MSTIDRLALLISLIAFAAAAFVADRVYEGIPHIEDEMAYVWQARAIAGGKITVPSPEPNPDSFLVPFVVDYNGHRFGKYPIGWPVVLAFGELVNARQMVNPLLTGLAIWLIYRLTKKLLDERTALLAAFLAAISPFVVMNGGSMLSHPLSLFLTVLLCIGWLDAATEPNPLLPRKYSRTLPAVTAALALGLLVLTRPWTAAAVALPFFAHGLYLLMRGDRSVRYRVIGIGAGASVIAGLYFLWQYAVTGDPLLNPYLLWWPYDKVGFGPGIGAALQGHSFELGIIHTQFSLFVGNSDLFGWPRLSWIFIPFGLWAVRRERRVWLVSAVLPSLVIAYLLYWTPSWITGPRYYYEALYVPVILTAAGIRWLSGRGVGSLPAVEWSQAGKLRFALITGLAGLLIASSLLYYMPARIGGMVGLYGVSTDCTQPIRSSLVSQPDPTLVFVHVQQRYYEYACLIDLNTPFLDKQNIIAISRSPKIDLAVISAFPGRVVLHYYPDTRKLHQHRREIPPRSALPGS